jgi:hypothetical protein
MKFNFFAKKGRPTLIEQEVCKKILNLVKKEVVTESEIQDYINKNGTASSFEDLEFLHTYLTGEVPIEEYSNSSLYNDTKLTRLSNPLRPSKLRINKNTLAYAKYIYISIY